MRQSWRLQRPPGTVSPFLVAAPQAVPGALPALHLLLMPLGLAVAAGLFVLLPSAPGSAVEATPLVQSLLASRASWQHFPATSALEPILAELLVSLAFHDILASFAYHASGREGDHGGIEVLDAFAVAAMSTPQDVSLLAAGKALLAVLLLQLRSWESILDLGQLCRCCTDI